MTEDHPHMYTICPFCKDGVVDSTTGTAQHTAEKLVWVGVQCSKCHRPFTYTATRVIPSSETPT